MTNLLLQVVYYHGQILAMNECGYRLMYRSKYVLVQDMDEFVVPTVASDWSSMLDDITSVQRERIASYSFRTRFFPLELPDNVSQVCCDALLCCRNTASKPRHKGGCTPTQPHPGPFDPISNRIGLDSVGKINM